MNVALVGIGNMGLGWLGASLLRGHRVMAIDKDPAKVRSLLDGSLLEGEEVIWKEIRAKCFDRLQASTRLQDLRGAEVIFIAVQTPAPDGQCDYGPLLNLLDALQKVLVPGQILLLGSTVFPGDIREKILPKIPPGVVFAYEPVFVRAGSGVTDYLHPGKVIVGVEDPDKPPRPLQEFFTSLTTGYPTGWCRFEEAEFIKLMHNTFMCVKISFANEVATFCNRFSVNPRRIMELTFRESARGRLLTFSHMVPGPPYSGTCLPKDSAVLMRMLDEIDGRHGGDFQTLRGAIQSNEDQVDRLVNYLHKHAWAEGGVAGCVGLTYRPGYTDIRDSLFWTIRKRLAVRGPPVAFIGYDPVFAGLSKERYGLLCRQNAELLAMYDEVTLSLEQVLERSRVLIVNRPLTRVERVAVGRFDRPMLNLYEHFGGSDG